MKIVFYQDYSQAPNNIFSNYSNIFSFSSGICSLSLQVNTKPSTHVISIILLITLSVEILVDSV